MNKLDEVLREVVKDIMDLDKGLRVPYMEVQSDNKNHLSVRLKVTNKKVADK